MVVEVSIFEIINVLLYDDFYINFYDVLIIYVFY